MADKYFSGKPCKRGHLTERLVSSRACCECQREKNANVYKANSEMIRLATAAYRKANPEKTKQGQRLRRERNIESERARDKQRFLANKDEHIARLNAWNLANPERTKQRIKAWEKANPGKVLAKAAKRRFSKLQQMPAWADRLAIECVYEKAAEMRKEGMDVHVDHIIPLQGRNALGLHVHNNLQIISANANRRKSNSLRGI